MKVRRTNRFGFVRRELCSLLKNAENEQQVHAFLEKHPLLLPGIFELHNGPIGKTIISKFPLGAEFRTDFAFITANSMECQVTFIELEPPQKKLFNRDDTLNSHFWSSIQQVQCWIDWFHKNKDYCFKTLGSLFKGHIKRSESYWLKIYLICGRRKEIEGHAVRQARWSSLPSILDKRKIEILTYDRLIDSPYIGIESLWPEEYQLSVCIYKDQKLLDKFIKNKYIQDLKERRKQGELNLTESPIMRDREDRA